jgi:hypothetical protein
MTVVQLVDVSFERSSKKFEKECSQKREEQRGQSRKDCGMERSADGEIHQPKQVHCGQDHKGRVEVAFSD